MREMGNTGKTWLIAGALIHICGCSAADIRVCSSPSPAASFALSGCRPVGQGDAAFLPPAQWAHRPPTFYGYKKYYNFNLRPGFTLSDNQCFFLILISSQIGKSFDYEVIIFFNGNTEDVFYR